MDALCSVVQTAPWLPSTTRSMLFDKFSARSLKLTKRLATAPMTRSRATRRHTPDALMATYYGQRATAGLIITEGFNTGRPT